MKNKVDEDNKWENEAVDKKRGREIVYIINCEMENTRSGYG